MYNRYDDGNRPHQYNDLSSKQPFRLSSLLPSLLSFLFSFT
jgi:hypothetical protein